MDLQLKMQLRVTLQNYLNDLMTTNNIAANLMEDALEHNLLWIREMAAAEYADWAMQDKAAALQELEKQLTAPNEESSEGSNEQEE